MTKKQIIERLKAAGVTGYDKKNVTELEALAAENGVSLMPDGTGEDSPDGPVPFTDDGRGVTLDVIGERGVKVQMAPAGDAYQAVCEEFSDLAGFGNTRLNAVEDLAQAIEAKLEADALDDAGPTGEPAVTSTPTEGEYDATRLITPQEACSYFEGDPTSE